LGRGRELAEVALDLERAAKKAEALAPPRFSDLVAAWRAAKTYKTTTALSEAITRCLGHARQDEIREEVQAALPGKDLFDTEVLDALWAARLKACGIQP
jgi:ABC-type branched-subunit amino acid transport system substrate-binding protein